MGFLDQELGLQRRQELMRQAELERARVAREAQSTTQRVLDEEKAHTSEDNEAIIALLDSLPNMTFDEYLRVVAKHTGYSPQLVLYTRLALHDRYDQVSILEQNQELRDKLVKKGINPLQESCSDNGVDYFPVSTIHQKNMFCGDDIKAKKGFLGLESITEPQEPGIGLRFRKLEAEKRTGLTREGTVYVKRVYSLVYARLTYPSTAIITGRGDKVTFASVKVFDDALAHGFTTPHRLVSNEYNPGPPYITRT